MENTVTKVLASIRQIEQRIVSETAWLASCGPVTAANTMAASSCNCKTSTLRRCNLKWTCMRTFVKCISLPKLVAASYSAFVQSLINRNGRDNSYTQLFSSSLFRLLWCAQIRVCETIINSRTLKYKQRRG